MWGHSRRQLCKAGREPSPGNQTHQHLDFVLLASPLELWKLNSCCLSHWGWYLLQQPVYDIEKIYELKKKKAGQTRVCKHDSIDVQMITTCLNPCILSCFHWFSTTQISASLHLAENVRCCYNHHQGKKKSQLVLCSVQSMISPCFLWPMPSFMTWCLWQIIIL